MMQRQEQAQRQRGGVPGFTPAELAAYLGTTTRTIRRWQQAGLIPEPARRSDKGWAIWSPDQAREIKAWKLLRS